MTQAAKFEVGKTYYARSIGDHNCIIRVTIAKRTNKSVTTTDGQRFMISTRYSPDETIYPWGKFSMCPSLSAEKELVE